MWGGDGLDPQVGQYSGDEGGAIMYQGRLRTLRSVKVDVERIDAGSDCGLSFRDWEEVEVGDVVEAYEE